MPCKKRDSLESIACQRWVDARSQDSLRRREEHLPDPPPPREWDSPTPILVAQCRELMSHNLPGNLPLAGEDQRGQLPWWVAAPNSAEAASSVCVGVGVSTRPSFCTISDPCLGNRPGDGWRNDCLGGCRYSERVRGGEFQANMWALKHFERTSLFKRASMDYDGTIAHS